MNARFGQTLVAILILLAGMRTAAALDHITVREGGRTTRLSGRLEAEAEDGGVLLLTADGTLRAFQPDEYTDRRRDAQPFKPLSREEMTTRLLQEMPAGFKVHTTANYLICYNTSKAYAEWCGALYERLYRGFRNYWDHRGLALRDPELPLVAMVYDSQATYHRHVRDELGQAAESIVGFYSPTSNRVNMYDLTGVEGLLSPNERITTSALVNQILQKPAAAPMVATIVHEATHQLAYNCGLQTRMADNPVWVSEGLAVYFETPDLKNSKGWSGIGSVNRGRLVQFRRYLAQRPADALARLIRNDQRFKDTSQALDAYAEAWALNYFLLRTRSKEYVAYLRTLSQKPPAVFDSPDERLAEFEAAFGDLTRLDAEFLRHIRKLD